MRKYLALLIAATAACAAVPQPVRVEGGLVSGLPGRAKTVTAFKGIPFAAPPVGELRWRAPRPVAAWQGVKKAEQFGASCVQTITQGKRGFGPWTYEFLTHNEVSEDCLYLNVWTPAKSAAAKLPVFVWIYGGAFNSGSGEVPLYDGEGLARKGVVVVTFNYRVGLFGFLAHPELTKESGYGGSGNYGLLDQVAALRWVRDNIAAFGGDPGRVAIAGQSAGSISVHYMMASPLARGLFQRAIAQSGGSSLSAGSGVPVLVPPKLGEAEADGVRFAESKGASSLGALRAMSWQKLMEAVPGSRSGPMRFAPIVDGYVAPQSPMEALLEGKLADVPVMTGCTVDEISGGITGPLPPITAEAFQNQMRKRYGASADEFLKLYPASTGEEATAARAASSRDASLVAMYLWARKRAASARTKTYLYLWDHAMPGPDAARYGAFHSSELAYIFDSLTMSDRPFTEADNKIAARMSSYWASFAAAGDPNGKGLPAWPAVDAKRMVMELGDKNGPVPLAASPERIAFFEKGVTDDHVAATQQGQVRGKLVDGRIVFQAIPFARPPVGDLRWREPQPPKGWEGARDATAPAPACVQVDWKWNHQDAVDGREDCLYLNIVTPSLHPAEPLPVMFWIHGGANYNGSGRFMAGETLTKHGVILVSINYRLGVFGFLAHPELTAESAHHASGNYGLMDQLAALRWVRDNIAAFGGDPRRITVFGQSAGAMDTGVLLTSPRSEGLFAGAIAESGGPIVPNALLATLKEAESIGTALAASAGAAAGAGQLAALRAMPAQKILEATERFTAPDAEGVPTHQGPSMDVDGWVLTEQPAARVEQGAVVHVPLIIGSNIQEFSFSRSSVIRAGEKEPAEQLKKMIRRVYGEQENAALALYGLDRADAPAPDPQLGSVGTQLMTDSYFRCPAIIASGWLSAKGASVWQYRFEHPLPGTGSASTRHSGELAYVFGWAQRAGKGFMGASYGPEDAKISDQVQGYWTNFAKTGDPNGRPMTGDPNGRPKTGDPNGRGLPQWPKFEESTADVLRITSEGPVPTRLLTRGVCGVYRQHLETVLGR